VAQVHKAKLKSGETVAVKILRPNIVKRMSNDMDVLGMVASLAETFVPDTRRLGPKEFIKTAGRAVMLELDLRLEAAAASELTEPGKLTGFYRVPKLHWDLGGKNVLVTEWIDGKAVSDETILTDADYDPIDIARNVMQSFLACSFDYGVFHADMHEGNMIITPRQADGKPGESHEQSVVTTLRDHRNFRYENAAATHHVTKDNDAGRRRVSSVGS